MLRLLLLLSVWLCVSAQDGDFTDRIGESAQEIADSVADAAGSVIEVGADEISRTMDSAVTSVENDLNDIIDSIRNSDNVQTKFELIRNRTDEVVRKIASVSSISSSVLVVEASEIQTSLQQLVELCEEDNEEATFLAQALVAKFRRFIKSYVGSVGVATTMSGKEMIKVFTSMIQKVRNDPEATAVINNQWQRLKDFIASFEEVATVEGSSTFKRIREDLNFVMLKLKEKPENKDALATIKNRTITYADGLSHVVEVASMTAVNGLAMALVDMTQENYAEDLSIIITDFVATFAAITSEVTTKTGYAIVDDLNEIVQASRGDVEVHDRLLRVRENLKTLIFSYTQLMVDIGNKASGKFMEDTVNTFNYLRSAPILEDDLNVLQKIVEDFLVQVNEITMVVVMTAGRSISRDLKTLKKHLKGNKAAVAKILAIDATFAQMVSKYSGTSTKNTISFADFFNAQKDVSVAIDSAWAMDTVAKPGLDEDAAHEMFDFYDQNKDGKLDSEEIEKAVQEPKMGDVTAMIIGAAAGLAAVLMVGFILVVAKAVFEKNRGRVRWHKLSNQNDVEQPGQGKAGYGAGYDPGMEETELSTSRV